MDESICRAGLRGQGQGKTMERKALMFVALGLLVIQQLAVVSYPVTIPFGRSWPLAVAVDSSRGLAYFDASSGDYPPTGFLFGVFNLTSHEVVRVLPLDLLPGPVVLDRPTGDVYVAGNESIEVFPFANQSAPRDLHLGRPVLDLVHDGTVSRNLFISSGDSVYSIDPLSGAVVARADALYGAGGMALDPVSGRLFVAQYLSGVIEVFDSSNLTRVGSVALPFCCASQLAINTRTQTLYAATRTNMVDLVNAQSLTFVKSVPVAPSPNNSTNEIAVDNETGRVFVSSSPGGSVIVLDDGGNVVGSFSVVSQVAGLAVDPRTHELYATNYHQITVFDVSVAPPSYVPVLAGGAALIAAAIAVYVLVRRRGRAEMANMQGMTGVRSDRGFRRWTL